MQFDDLWIGDEVFVKSKGVNGRWDGLVSRKEARIRIGEKTFLISLTEIEEARQLRKAELPKKVIISKSEKVSQEPKSSEIDLHIETLSPERKNDLPEMILNYQLKRCQSFISDCIKDHRPTALIIHGKGTGLLKSEVLHMLEGTPEVKFTFPKKDGGATEVWFSSPY